MDKDMQVFIYPTWLKTLIRHTEQEADEMQLFNYVQLW